MSDNSLVDKANLDTIEAGDPNQYKTALGGDLVPRNASGVATSGQGRAGTRTIPFKRANITTGYLFVGQIMPFLDYDGALTPGQGWLPCNETLVSKATYDAVHGTGSWDLYVISSPLETKYTPFLHGSSQRYLVGATDTTQDGVTPITSVGNPDHEYTIPGHSHTSPSHNHTVTRTIQSVFNSGVSTGLLSLGSTTGANASADSSTSGAVPRDTKPQAIPIQFWIRII